MKLLLADQHVVVREGVKDFLEPLGFKIMEYKDGEAALESVQKHNFGLAILGMGLPKSNGIQSLGRMKLERPDLPVILLDDFENPQHVASALAYGASAYLTMETTRQEFVSSVKQVLDGENLFHRSMLRRSTAALRTLRMPASLEVPLTRREGEILQHIAQGETNNEIGKSLQISYETVKEHVQHLLKKIGVGDRTQAAVWAVRKGIILE